MPLKLVTADRSSQLSTERKLEYIRSELVSELEGQLAHLRASAERIRACMELTIHRIRTSGIYADVADPEAEAYGVIRGRIMALQEQMAVIESVDD